MINIPFASRKNNLLSLGMLLAFFLLVFFSWLSVFFLLGIHNKPPTGDEVDYINRGVAFLTHGWGALSDGWRPPLLPLLVAFVKIFAGESSLLNAVRITNIAFVSIVPVLWLGEYFVKRKKVFAFMAFFTALWPAYYLFSFSVYAEAASFLILNILLILSIRIRNSDKFLIFHSVGFSLCLAMLFLFKANNILVSVPFGLYVLFFGVETFRRRFYKVSLIALLSLIMISPWLIYLKSELGGWVATTTGGYNLLVGTGHHSFGMVGDDRAIHSEYFKDVYGEEFKGIGEDERFLLSSQSDKYSADKLSKEMAMEIWSKDTSKMLGYSVRKVMHSYGMSFRGLMDYVTFAFFLSVIIVSFLLIYIEKLYAVLFLMWSMIFVGSFVSFLWLPNIRFKVFYFDTVAFYMLACFASLLIDYAFYYRKYRVNYKES